MKLLCFNIVTILFLSLLSACTESVPVAETDITYSVENLSSSTTKFGNRSVGIEQQNGFRILLTVGNRESIVAYERNNMNAAPDKEFLSKIESGIEITSSPDKLHIAMRITDSNQVVKYFHLLPSGTPFTIEKYNPDKATNFQEINWSSLPSPEEIAISFIEENSSNTLNYPIRNKELWNAIASIMPDSTFDDLVISCWPNVFETHDIIDSIIAKDKNYDTPFYQKLELRIEEVFNQNTSKTNKIRAIIAGYELNREYLNETLYNHLISMWPESPVLINFVKENYNNLPILVQDQLIEKSVAYSQQTESNAYKSVNKKFLLEFADSLTISSLP